MSWFVKSELFIDSMLKKTTNYNLSLLILSYYCFCEFEYSQAYFFLLCSPTSIWNYPPPQMEKLKTFLTLKHMFF